MDNLEAQVTELKEKADKFDAIAAILGLDGVAKITRRGRPKGTAKGTGRRGRPKGSKNKPKTAMTKAKGTAKKSTGKRGRPKGSKNKPKDEAAPAAAPAAS